MSNTTSLIGQCPKCGVTGVHEVSEATHHPMENIQPVTCGQESCHHQTLFSEWREQGDSWQYMG